jgi:hypothetical protein
VAHREVSGEQGEGGLSKAAFARLGHGFLKIMPRTNTDTVNGDTAGGTDDSDDDL